MVTAPRAGVRPASRTQLPLLPWAPPDWGWGPAHTCRVLGAKAGNASGLLSESQFPPSGTPELGPTYLEACSPSPSSGGGVGASGEKGEGEGRGQRAPAWTRQPHRGRIRPPARGEWELGTPAGWSPGQDAQTPQLFTLGSGQKSAWLPLSLLPPHFLFPVPLKPNQAGHKAKQRNQDENDASPAPRMGTREDGRFFISMWGYFFFLLAFPTLHIICLVYVMFNNKGGTSLNTDLKRDPLADFHLVSSPGGGHPYGSPVMQGHTQGRVWKSTPSPKKLPLR